MKLTGLACDPMLPIARREARKLFFRRPAFADVGADADVFSYDVDRRAVLFGTKSDQLVPSERFFHSTLDIVE
jgi:hypothetical protein